MHTYKVIVTRDDRWWMITVPELAGYVGRSGAVNVGDTTQARRVSEIPSQAVDFICTVTDCAPSEVAVEISIDVDGIDVTGRADKVAHDQELAEHYKQSVALGRRELAIALAEKGVALRDVGDVLGMSFQRVQQLISA